MFYGWHDVQLQFQVLTHKHKCLLLHQLLHRCIWICVTDLRRYHKYDWRCSNLWVLHLSCWVVAKYLQTCVELVETLVSLMGNSFCMEKRKVFLGVGGRSPLWLLAQAAGCQLAPAEPLCHAVYISKTHFWDQVDVRSTRNRGCLSIRSPVSALPLATMQV